MIHLRIAMLGDDRSQLFALRSCLLTAGYVAQHYETAADFLCAVSTAGFDTLILGSSVKDLTGLEVLTRVRAELNLTAPVIMVTPSKREDYIVKVLRGGADECITTPVGDREFLARLEAVTRRWVNAPSSVPLFPSWEAHGQHRSASNTARRTPCGAYPQGLRSGCAVAA